MPQRGKRMSTNRHLLVFGLGYTGRAVATAASDSGWRVTGISRVPTGTARAFADALAAQFREVIA